MEIEIALTNGPLIGLSFNYPDDEYPYNEFEIYLLFFAITFRWN